MAGSGLLPPKTQETYHEYDPEEKILREYNIFTGEVVSEGPYNPGLEHKLTGRGMAFSERACEIIFDLLMQGKTLDEITKMPGMPSLSIITRWRAFKPEFDELILQARRARAELLYDQVLSESEATGANKDELAERKLRLEALKWSAERGNREAFAPTVPKEQGGAQTTIIEIHTGVPDFPRTEITISEPAENPTPQQKNPEQNPEQEV
jgi:hypothetical protein